MPAISAEDRARRFGLRYTMPDDLPLNRRRRGRGYQYLDAGGAPVESDAVKSRLKELRVPPAWTEVKLASDPLSHIQAVGRDAKGRLQYVYHDLWSQSADLEKAMRLKMLGGALGGLRESVEAQLRRRTVDRDFAMACAIALLDRAALRVGYEEYCRDTGGRGAMTLQRRHVRISDGAVRLSFYGKSSKRIQRTLDDPPLASALSRLREARGPNLFCWAKDGESCLNAEDVNDYLHREAGDAVSAKDFRTFRASALVLDAMEEEAPPTDKALRGAIKTAAEFLANTPAVCRSNYVHPLVQTACQDGLPTRKDLFTGPVREGLTRPETALMRLLDDC